MQSMLSLLLATFLRICILFKLLKISFASLHFDYKAACMIVRNMTPPCILTWHVVGRDCKRPLVHIMVQHLSLPLAFLES